MSDSFVRPFRRIARVAAPTLLLLAFAAGAHAAPPSGVPNPLRVGVTPNYPPLAFKENGRIVGIEADLAAQLGTDFGVKIEFVETPWEQLPTALDEGRIDVVMSGASVTDRRKELVLFTDPYLEVGQMVLVRRKDEARLSAPGALASSGVRVGVVNRTTGEQYAKENLDNATLVSFADVDAGIAALRKGDIDAFVHDAPTVWSTVGRPLNEDEELAGLYRPLTHEYLAWAVKKEGGEALRDFLNAALVRWRSDGTLERVTTRWIPVRRVTSTTK